MVVVIVFWKSSIYFDKFLDRRNLVRISQKNTYNILSIPSKPHSFHSVHSAIGSRMNGMIFHSFRKRNSSQKNTDTVYSEYSYSGIVPKERALNELNTGTLAHISLNHNTRSYLPRCQMYKARRQGGFLWLCSSPIIFTRRRRPDCYSDQSSNLMPVIGVFAAILD